MLYELTCAECSTPFSSAASLLKHFAEHASQVISQQESKSQSNNSTNKKSSIPDLYPISSYKTTFKQNKLNNDDSLTLLFEDNEENVDSGVEDVTVNPLRYCAVSLGELSPLSSTDVNEFNHNNEKFKSKCLRKYKCTYCLKTFGWSTDLKRHILTHTGERPFKCHICDSTFTRKFLLQKHQVKQHNNVGYSSVHSAMLVNKIKIPPLKPIGFILKRKSRKQDKQNIKRKVLNVKNLYQSVNDHFEISDNLVCST